MHNRQNPVVPRSSNSRKIVEIFREEEDSRNEGLSECRSTRKTEAKGNPTRPPEAGGIYAQPLEAPSFLVSLTHKKSSRFFVKRRIPEAEGFPAFRRTRETGAQGNPTRTPEAGILYAQPLERL